MIKVNTNTTQTIRFIPRDGNISCLVIKNETTLEQVELDLTEIVDVFGEELIINGDFSDGLNNWNTVGGNYTSIVNGALNSNNTVNGSWFAQYVTQSVNFVSGKIYQIKFKAKNVSGDIGMRITENANVIFSGNLNPEFTDYKVYYTAVSNNSNIRIFCNDAIGEFQIDNISVKEFSQDTEIHYQELNNYVELEMNLPEGFFQESVFYTVKALDENHNVLFYDKMFCTDLEDYTINNNVYNPVVIEDKEYKIYKG